jgi:hypothetical protein
MSSSIGLFLFLLLCWRPNAIKHDTHQDANSKDFLRFEVFTAVTIKNVVFWDMVPYRYSINLRLGGTYRLHLQGRRKKSVIEEEV